MLEGRFYGGACWQCRATKKKSKTRQNCWTRKVELVINNQIQATILIGCPLVILLYQYLYSLLIHACAMFQITIPDVAILKKGFVKGRCAYSISNSEFGNQRNRSCDTILESWD